MLQNKTKERNLNWPQIPDHPYRMLITGCSGSGSLLNLINHQPDINNIFLYAKDPYEEKYQFLIDNQEITSFKHFNEPKAFIEYSDNMDDIYKNIEEYNPNKERKILIVFDDMIANLLSNKNVIQQQSNYLLKVENETFLLFLLCNLTFLYRKILD